MCIRDRIGPPPKIVTFSFLIFFALWLEWTATETGSTNAPASKDRLSGRTYIFSGVVIKKSCAAPDFWKPSTFKLSQTL